MGDALDDLRERLQGLGAIKLAWSIERQTVEGHSRWIFDVQAANEMGAPVELPPEVGDDLRQAIHDGEMGALEEGVWLMDVQTGHISPPQPRTGEGASAPGLAERLP